MECGSRTVEKGKLARAKRKLKRRDLYAGTQKRRVIFKSIVRGCFGNNRAYMTSPYRNLYCVYMRVHQRVSFLAALARNLGLLPRFA